MGEPAIRLVPRAEPKYQECPRWCLGHFEDDGVRRHTGPTEVVAGSRPILLGVEMTDDGHGSANTTYYIDVAGVRVEMRSGRMHDLVRAAERVFWKLDKHGVLIHQPRPHGELLQDVRRHLDRTGVKQAELARQANISASLLSLILSGQRGCSDSVAKALSDAIAPAPAAPLQSHGGRA